MAIEDDFHALVDSWKLERAKLDDMKARKATIQSELAQLNDQINAQQPVVVAARVAMKQKATEI